MSGAGRNSKLESGYFQPGQPSIDKVTNEWIPRKDAFGQPVSQGEKSWFDKIGEEDFPSYLV